MVSRVQFCSGGCDMSSSVPLCCVTAVEFGWREFRSVTICSVSAVTSGLGELR